MRLIHTADWQLGKPYGRFDSDVRAALTEARFDAIDTLGKAAAENMIRDAPLRECRIEGVDAKMLREMTRDEAPEGTEPDQAEGRTGGSKRHARHGKRP